MFLFCENWDPDDHLLHFEEESHTYHLLGHPEVKFTSVTTFVHRLFEPFRAERVISQFYDNWQRNKNSPYYGKQRSEIYDMWERNRIESANTGTMMHAAIECYYDDVFDSHQSGIMWESFLRFDDEYVKGHLRPFRVEKRVFDLDTKLAGSIDMIFFEPSTGKYKVYDWKFTSKPLQKTAFRGKASIHPDLSHIPDTNYFHYSIQLHVYRWILLHVYNYPMADECTLVVFLPNGDFCVEECHDVRTEVDMLMRELM